MYRFYSSAKDQLVIKLANGSFDTADHRHDFIGDVSSPLKTIVLEVDPSFNVDKIPVLQSAMYRALMGIHEGNSRTLAETLPEILRWCGG